jgi:protein PhnA
MLAWTGATPLTVGVGLRWLGNRSGALQIFCIATAWSSRMSVPNVKDSNGTALSEGDSVTVIKDLKVKGTSLTLKRGTLVKDIHLTDDEEEIECRVDKIKGLVLKTCFLKKA